MRRCSTAPGGASLGMELGRVAPGVGPVAKRCSTGMCSSWHGTSSRRCYTWRPLTKMMRLKIGISQALLWHTHVPVGRAT